MPSVRPAELILAEVGDADGAFSLWRILTDLQTWSNAPEELRTGVFHAGASAALELPAGIAAAGPPFARIWSPRDQPAFSELTRACAVVWEWAERQGHTEVALQFAEAAARLDPHSAARASTAGRLCRRKSERIRGTMWFRRAVRLARLSREKKAEIEFAIAHLGWGNLESDLGRFQAAEYHATKGFKAALRAGRRSLAASAYHDLMTISIHTERFERAEAFARDAVAFYRSDHPRLPALAHDVAFLWSRLGYFSSATPLYEMTLPFVALTAERVVVLANLARAAGACRDRLRYERAFQSIDQLAATGGQIPASAFYHVAEGCRSFEEWARAGRYCTRALEAARSRGNALIVAQAERLARQIDAREPGDVDTLPPLGGAIDQMRETLMRKMRKHPVPAEARGAVPPEKYPIER